MSGAKVKYSVYRSRYWFPLWHDADDDSEEPQAADDSGDGGDSGDQLSEMEGQLDADGKLALSFPTAVSDHKYDYVYRIDAHVTDQANREIIGRSSVIATYGSFAVNIEPERYFYAPGAKAAFTVQARTYDNQPVRARARVELVQWNRRNPDRWDSRGSTDVDLGADGTATAYLDIPRQGGSYRVRVTARTPEGRDVADDSYLWVSGAGDGGFRGGRDQTVQIVLDKKSYRAGDTAKLLIVAGQPNTPVYVTVEGRDLRQYKLVRSPDSTVSFELPVTAADEPGITVTAAFIRDGNLYNGRSTSRIPPVEHELNVKRVDRQAAVSAGPDGANTASRRTAPMANPRRTPNSAWAWWMKPSTASARTPPRTSLHFFFDRNGTASTPTNSLEYYFNGEAGKRRMRLAELRPPSRLAQLKPERLVQPKDPQGVPGYRLLGCRPGHRWRRPRARQSRVSGFAHHLAGHRARRHAPIRKWAAPSLKTIVRKNLILRLAVPRFFVQGDEVVISALVHNYLADAKRRASRWTSKVSSAGRRHEGSADSQPRRSARWIGACARSRCAAPPLRAKR